jgi:hypothetical protein
MSPGAAEEISHSEDKEKKKTLPMEKGPNTLPLE